MNRKKAAIPPTRKIDIADAIANLGDAFAGAVAGVPGALVETDYRIAALYAPVFRQALGDSPRYDYITRFDFDGDWVGDNN